MKKIKGLFIIFLVSFLFLGTEAFAKTYLFYAKDLKTFSGTTEIGRLTKDDDLDPQVLVIDSVHDNRSISYNVNGHNWIKIKNPSGKIVRTLGHGQYEIFYLPSGVQVLQMKASSWHITETPVGGSWWVSQDEYNIYKGVLS